MKKIANTALIAFAIGLAIPFLKVTVGSDVSSDQLSVPRAATIVMEASLRQPTANSTKTPGPTWASAGSIPTAAREAVQAATHDTFSRWPRQENRRPAASATWAPTIPKSKSTKNQSTVLSTTPKAKYGTGPRPLERGRPALTTGRRPVRCVICRA